MTVGLSRLFRGAFHGFSEEARTRGFPSPPFGGFGFIVAATKHIAKSKILPVGQLNLAFLATKNVCFGLRLCNIESIFLTDQTAHHNDICWRLGDAMHSHMRAHPYVLNGTFLAVTSEIRSSVLQFPVVKNKISFQEK